MTRMGHIAVLADPDLPVDFGRYRLLSVLGEGGMARVFRAELVGPHGFRKSTAVKVIGVRGAEHERAGLIRSFIGEARLGGLLHHPNIVETYEFGVIEGEPFIVMELVRGVGLDRILREGNRPPPPLSVEIAAQICAGLAHAHALRDGDAVAGVVHRDLKPSNVFINFDGLVKVMDFGIAKALVAVGDRTRSGFTKGTPAYMSPEQASGEALDGRSDLFSVGAVLYELLTGERFFSGDNLLKVLMKVARVEDQLEPQGPLAQAEAVLPGAGAVLRRLLRLDPNQRYHEAAEAEAAFRTLIGNRLVSGALREWAQRWAPQPQVPPPLASPPAPPSGPGLTADLVPVGLADDAATTDAALVLLDGPWVVSQQTTWPPQAARVEHGPVAPARPEPGPTRLLPVHAAVLQVRHEGLLHADGLGRDPPAPPPLPLLDVPQTVEVPIHAESQAFAVDRGPLSVAQFRAPPPERSSPSAASPLVLAFAAVAVLIAIAAPFVLGRLGDALPLPSSGEAAPASSEPSPLAEAPRAAQPRETTETTPRGKVPVAPVPMERSSRPDRPGRVPPVIHPSKPPQPKEAAPPLTIPPPGLKTAETPGPLPASEKPFGGVPAVLATPPETRTGAVKVQHRPPPTIPAHGNVWFSFDVGEATRDCRFELRWKSRDKDGEWRTEPALPSNGVVTLVVAVDQRTAASGLDYYARCCRSDGACQKLWKSKDDPQKL